MFIEYEIFATEEDLKVVKEVMVFNDILKAPNQSESILLDVLGRLDRLRISEYTLKETMIGEAVSPLKIHRSELRLRARALFDKWKRMISTWIDAAHIAEEESDTVSEEAKKFQAKTDADKPNKALIQKQAQKETRCRQKPKRVVLRSKGKPLLVIELEKQTNKYVIQKKPLVDEEKSKGVDETKKIQAAPKRLRDNYQQAENGSSNLENQTNKYVIQKKPLVDKEKPEGVTAQKRLRDNYQQAENGLSSLENQTNKYVIQKKPFVKGVNEAKKLQAAQKRLRDNYQQAEHAKRQRRIEVVELEKQLNEHLIPKKPIVEEEKLPGFDEERKLQAVAKRLRDNYQQAENAKRQRRIQVLDLHNLPKKSLGQKNVYIKSKGFATKSLLSCK